jgi:hypothetical protein
VVRNSPEVHSRIESLLAELRKVKTSPESKKGR